MQSFKNYILNRQKPIFVQYRPISGKKFAHIPEYAPLFFSKNRPILNKSGLFWFGKLCASKLLKNGIIFASAALLFYSSMASAELVVIGNPNIKAKALTQKELSALYLGKPIKISTKENLKPYSQPSSSDIYREFYQKIIGWNSEQASSYWTSQIF